MGEINRSLEASQSENESKLDISPELQESIREQAEEVLVQYKDIPNREEVEEALFKSSGVEHETEERKLQFSRAVDSCIRECERVARLAVGLEADNIVFLDDSARVYGSMVFKILKMVKLEYAKIKNISPEEVKIPQVKYINPSSGP